MHCYEIPSCISFATISCAHGNCYDSIRLTFGLTWPALRKCPLRHAVLRGKKQCFHAVNQYIGQCRSLTHCISCLLSLLQPLKAIAEITCSRPPPFQRSNSRSSKTFLGSFLQMWPYNLPLLLPGWLLDNC